MAVSVRLGIGKHTMAYPKQEMEELIEKKLEAAGFNFLGDINAFVVSKIKGTSFRGQAGIIVPPTGLRGNSIIFIVQTKDNSSCFRCHVIIPGEKEMVRALFERLRVQSPVAEPATPIEPPVVLPAIATPKQKDDATLELPRLKLEVADLLNDPDLLQVILLSLSEKVRGRHFLSGTECVTVLMAAVGGPCSRRQFVPLLEQLLRRGYLIKETTKNVNEKPRYTINRKASPTPEKSFNSKKKNHSLPRPENKRKGAKLFGIFLKVEKHLVALQTEEQNLRKRMTEISTTKENLIRKKEGLKKKISEALK